MRPPPDPVLTRRHPTKGGAPWNGIDKEVSVIVSCDSGENAADRLCAIMVGAAGGCKSQGAPTWDALRPLIVRTSQAILLSTGCVHPHSQCPTSLEICGVRLQVWSNDLNPVESSVVVVATIGVNYREVETWLDTGPAVRSRPRRASPHWSTRRQGRGV